jgi:hypothetical protein
MVVGSSPVNSTKKLVKTATYEWLFSFLFQALEYEQNMADIHSNQGRRKAGGIYDVQTDKRAKRASGPGRGGRASRVCETPKGA